MNEDRVDFYANSVSISTNIYDVLLSFGIQTPITASNEEEVARVDVSTQCNVRMSPQHAKALAALLVKHVKEYEQRFGILLPLPEEIADFWNEHIKRG
ncbi:MAG TPA: DUF3467 domain-containing protein [Chloroflexi bacterium]|nr:DUF3467 domain-containing protein [Chloroflexota bacterium]